MTPSLTKLQILLLVCCILLPHSSAQGTDLGGGTITRIDVSEYADLALDLRDIRSYIESEQTGPALGLYEEGLHSEITPGFKQSLQKIIQAVVNAETHTPIYHFHLYGLTSRSTNLFEMDTRKYYADTRIQQTFSSNLALADHAILALGLWMYATHVLFEGVAVCEKRTNADNPDFLEIKGGGMDEFIAIWIGRDQESASSNGHSLYAWTQQIGEIFDMNQPEHPTNSRLRLLYEEGVSIINQPRACTSQNPDSVRELWKIVTQISHEMTRPLYQWLLYYLVEEEQDAVQIYATALIPQLSRCRPSTYKSLYDALVERTVSFSSTNEIQRNLKDSYQCFGFTCADIGTIEGSAETSCDDASLNKLAGYQPTTDISSLSRIDLDIYQLRILSSTQLDFYTKLWYMYGFNSPIRRENPSDPYEIMSLHDMAISAKRQLADPIYTYFVDYYDQKSYSDKNIIAAIDNKSKWKTPMQRTEVIVLSSAFQIVYMQVVAQLNDTVQQCKDSDPSVGFLSLSHPIDEAAALFIGSMELETLGGSTDIDDGQLLFGLGNQRAYQFGTFNDENYARVNSEIVDRFYAAKGEVSALDCRKLELTTKRIERLLMVSIFQSAIHYAIENEGQPVTSTAAGIAAGEVFAESVLPLIDSFDAQTAEVIAENMISKEGVTPVRDGAAEVADAFAYAFKNGFDLNCRYLGSTGEVQPCRNLGVGASSAVGTFLGSALLLTLSTVCIIIL